MTANLQRTWRIGLWLLGFLLVGINFHLLSVNRSLSQQIAAFYRSISLPLGATLPPIVGTSRSGDLLILDSSRETDPVLILVFSTSCPFCDENWPHWQTLIRSQQNNGGKTVLVSMLDEVRDDYLEYYNVTDIPLIVSPTPETHMAYRFRFTPQTMILMDGRLVGGWMGVLEPENVMQAIDLLAGRETETLSEDT